MNTLKHFIQDKTKLLYLIISCMIIGFVISLFVFPSMLYDQFIWKYFWGPIMSDALDQTMNYNGIQAAPKFTLVSEIVYGILVIIALYGLYKIINKYKIHLNTWFFIAILPYVIYGSVVRVLEDASFFSEPFVYWFVTPLVYFQTLFFFLVILFIGLIITEKFSIMKEKLSHIIFFGGICLLIPFVYFTSQWMIGNQWSYSNGVRFDVFVLVSIFLLIIAFIVYGIGKYGSKRYPWLLVYTQIINLSMIIGHMLDGITSWISIYDPFKMGLPVYIEKHPASDLLMQLWPPLFPIIKFILIIIIIYLFDVLYKNDLKEYQRFVPLIKIGIFILGFAPGLRDLLRVCMGV